MKRVVCCALCMIFLIASVSADISIPPAGKTIPPTTQQIIVKPSILVSIKQSATPTQLQSGSLEVYSNPSEAEVVIFDNQYKILGNYSTPLLMPISPLGSFNIAITLPGYRPYIGMITIQNGQTTVVSETLVPLSSATTPPVVSPTPQSQTDSFPTNTPPITQQFQPTSSGFAGTLPETTGSLSVTTTPAGADIAIDGEVKGITPAMISGLSPGTHTLTITKAGYRDFSTTISIETGRVREYSTGLSDAATPVGTPAAKSPGFAPGAVIAAIFCLALVRKGSW
jgi:hypothetical protein